MLPGAARGWRWTLAWYNTLFLSHYACTQCYPTLVIPVLGGHFYWCVCCGERIYWVVGGERKIHYTEQIKNYTCSSLFLKGTPVLYFPLGDFPGTNNLWSSITEKVAGEGDSDLQKKWTTGWAGEDKKRWWQMERTPEGKRDGSEKIQRKQFWESGTAVWGLKMLQWAGF